VNDGTSLAPNVHDLAILFLATHLSGVSTEEPARPKRMHAVLDLHRRAVEETSGLGPRDDVAERFRQATHGWCAEQRLDLLSALVFVDPFAPFAIDFEHRDLVDGWQRLNRLMHGDNEVELVEAARRRSVVVDLVRGVSTPHHLDAPLFGGILGLLTGPVAQYGLFGTGFIGAPMLARGLASIANLLGSGSHAHGGVGILGAGGSLLAGAGAALLALDVPVDHLDLELKILEIRARTAIETNQCERLARIGLVLDQLALDARAKFAREEELNRPGAPRIAAAGRFLHAVCDLRAWLPTKAEPAVATREHSGRITKDRGG
jgi:hypothetical protein